MDQSEITEKLTSLLRTVFIDHKIVLRNDLEAAKLKKTGGFQIILGIDTIIYIVYNNNIN